MKSHTVFESVMPCSGQYLWKRDLRLNGWLLAAVGFYLAQLFLLKRFPEWPPVGRGLIALSPLAPGLLYARDWLRFVRQLDELQRRIQTEAFLTSTLATLVLVIVVITLGAQGVELGAFRQIASLGGVWISLFVFWLVGLGIASRRYQ